MLLSSSQSVPHQSDPALRSMFEARKKVFVDLRSRSLPVLDGRFEVDQFDTPEAVYLILTDESANHRASARLLRTDRSHILAQLFPSLCEGNIPSGPKTHRVIAELEPLGRLGCVGPLIAPDRTETGSRCDRAQH